MIGYGGIVIVHAVQVVVRVIGKNKRRYARAIEKFERFEHMVKYAREIANEYAQIEIRLHNKNEIIKDQERWSYVGHHASILITDTKVVK